MMDFFGCITLVGFVDLVCDYERVAGFISDGLVGVVFSYRMMDCFACITLAGDNHIVKH